MSEKSEKKTVQVEPPKPIMFKCQFCEETKPMEELVILRQYYPILSCCRDCAKGPRTESKLEQ
jgi:hypothetical protein